MSVGDGEFVSFGDEEFVSSGVYEGLTRAVFCVAKAQDAIDAAKQRQSALSILRMY